MARLVAQAIPAARFVVAGKMCMASPLTTLTKPASSPRHQADPLLRERLIYLGFRAGRRARQSAADLVVAAPTSRATVWSTSSDGSGKPVVSTPRGWPRRTVAEGDTVLSRRSRDATGWPISSSPSCATRRYRQRMGEAGRARDPALVLGTTMAATFDAALKNLL